MAIQEGTKLGPYEILNQIGAGGMGEVYRAKDTRLDRVVAIKILPEHLSTNPDLKQRFEREARVISSLSHPHICTLHDIGQQDGIHFLVMEFVEGQTLAERLIKGALPIEQALRYGIQIVDSLEKAHKNVHRDLKPGNIMLTKSGVKLLDFGLAKLRPSVFQPLSGVSSLPTADHELTKEGTIVGTIQYMAPEQLEGRETDERTDIFAFGSVLYEMVFGKKAFTGKSQASLISAILSSEPPPVSSIQPVAPPMLGHIVKKCLAKEPDERWQSAQDIASELKWISEVSQTSLESIPVRQTAKAKWLLWFLIAAVSGAAALLITIMLKRSPEIYAGLVHSEISAPNGITFKFPVTTAGRL